MRRGLAIRGGGYIVYIPDIEVHRCRTLADAAELQRRFGPEARYLAGGTDLLVDLKTRRVCAAHVISLRGIAEMRGIGRENGALRIGALTTITTLDQSPQIRAVFPAIRDATSQMAVPQIRNIATVGGNLASGVPCADLPPVLIVLSASVRLWGPQDGFRSVPLDRFIPAVRRTVCRPEELVTDMIVPQPHPHFGAAYARFGLRAGNAIAVASVAASIRLDPAGMISDARICLGAVAPVPKLIPDAAARLLGRPADAEAFAEAAHAARALAEPISDIRGSADFRRELVEVLTRRALSRAAERAAETVA